MADSDNEATMAVACHYPMERARKRPQDHRAVIVEMAGIQMSVLAKSKAQSLAKATVATLVIMVLVLSNLQIRAHMLVWF
jgi:hypothetical protein